MSAPYFQDERLTLHHGDALDVLRRMAAGSVDCIVTSPPYFGLRDYGVDGQLGAEASPAEYVENMRALFAEARRVLADDGTLWLNLGDSYSTGTGNRNVGLNERWGNSSGARKQEHDNQGRSPVQGIPPKNLLGIPWRVAFALQDDGWILRNDIIWHKPNAMPESVTDRLSTRHEHLFMLTKSRRYWFDLDAIREDHTCDRLRGSGPRTKPGTGRNDSGAPTTSQRNELGKNPGDVWSINTVGFPEAHFAVMPPALAERCVQAGCKPGGIVLDPFSGSGTTGLAAAKHGRRYVGIDLNADYLDLSLRTRLQQPGLDLEGIA